MHFFTTETLHLTMLLLKILLGATIGERACNIEISKIAMYSKYPYTGTHCQIWHLPLTTADTPISFSIIVSPSVHDLVFVS